jgi:hypothetical protein
MASKKRFRILTPDGLLSRETFGLPAEQPLALRPGCVVVVNERTGVILTVHDTRLFPAEAAESINVVGEPKSVCLKCGKVKGVIEDQVSCPYHDAVSCGMMQPSQTTLAETSCVT